MLALVLYELSVKSVTFLLFCPVELESIKLEFLVMLTRYCARDIFILCMYFYFVDLES